jgi:hypothetical protein
MICKKKPTMNTANAALSTHYFIAYFIRNTCNFGTGRKSAKQERQWKHRRPKEKEQNNVYKHI